MICVFLNWLFQNCADGTSGFTRKCQNLEVPMRNIVWMKCKPNRDISILGNPWLIQCLPRKCLNMKGSMTSLFGRGIPWIMFFWHEVLVPGGPIWCFRGFLGNIGCRFQEGLGSSFSRENMTYFGSWILTHIYLFFLTGAASCYSWSFSREQVVSWWWVALPCACFL